jgi:hypothetical protein
METPRVLEYLAGSTSALAKLAGLGNDRPFLVSVPETLVVYQALRILIVGLPLEPYKYSMPPGLASSYLLSVPSHHHSLPISFFPRLFSSSRSVRILLVAGRHSFCCFVSQFSKRYPV